MPRRMHARGLFAALVGLGCGSAGDAADDGLETLRILPPEDAIAIKPRDGMQVVFRLVTERDQPVGKRMIRFAILDDPATPEDDARGATLSFDRGLTDDAGRVTLRVFAGQPAKFHLRASAARAADVALEVIVAPFTHGAVEIAPVIAAEAGAAAPPPVATIRLHFYDGVSDARACAWIPIDQPPPGRLHAPRSLAPNDTTVYTGIGGATSHTILAVGVDAEDKPRAAGCIDLSGSAVVTQESARVVLPLRRLGTLPEGQFRASSELRFRQPLRAAEALSSVWGELSECPLDPARLWLDCSLDALLPASAADPHDCRPGFEGPLGTQLAARRGVPLPGLAGGRCRDQDDADGRTSHDALVDRLFALPRPALLASLAALPAEIQQLLDTLRLQSILGLWRRTTSPDRFEADHRLASIAFPLAVTPVVIELRETAPPVPEARFVPVALRRDELQIATHGFTLRLGTSAHLAFLRSSLKQRGSPADVAAFLGEVFGHAARVEPGGRLTGCAALDAALCPDVGETRGCLMAACAEGLAALERRLLAGFEALDGEDLDLFLGGTAPIVDRDGDRKAEALGSNAGGGGALGAWMGEVRTRSGSGSLTGSWSAEIQP